MTIKGFVQAKVVVLEEGASLPNGTPVVIYPLVGVEQQTLTVEERLARLKELFALQLPVADWPQMEEEILRGALE